MGEIADELRSPEQFCFVKCVDSMIRTVRFRKPGQRVAVIFDQGVKEPLVDFAALYLSQQAKYPELAGIGFARVSDLLPLQGADMIAS